MADFLVTATNSEGVSVSSKGTIGISSSTLSIELAFTDGKFLAFDERGATDAGDYIGQFVHQHCFHTFASGNGDYRDGFSVFFRSDADGQRHEIVVEYGADVDFSTRPSKPARGIAAAHTPGYSATISGGSLTVPDVIVVAAHFFRERWRWQSAQRPLVRTAADLVAMKAILPLENTLVFKAGLPPSRAWRGPMDTGGFSPGMGAPGDRTDIGPTTEHMAAWLLTGDKGCETTWRAQAEATGSMPFWARDVATGNLVDPKRRLNAAFLDATGDKLPQAPVPSDPNYFRLQSSHMPAAAFVPWLLTDDPYYLEGAQAAALYAILETNLYRNYWKLPSLVNYVEPRGLAWGLRDLFAMTDFSPANTPSWLVPKSTWQAAVQDNRTLVQKYLDAKVSPCTTVFGLVQPAGKYETFMQDYIIIAIARAVWSGMHDDWRPFLDYISRMRMATSDPADASGWDHRFQVPYLIFVADARLGAAATGGPDAGPGIPASQNTPTSFSELWSLYSAVAPTGYGAGKAYQQQNWTPPSTWAPDKIVPMQIAYLPETRGALAALSLIGKPGAKEAHDWLRARMDSQFGSFPSVQTYKWAIISG